MAFSFEDLFDDVGRREEVDTTSYYKILGVDKKASLQEIRKAYRSKARELHPDRHPNEREKYHGLFQQLQKVYETLSDEHKRALYDRYGPDGVKHGNNNIMRPKRERQSPAIEHTIDVTLEDLYRGDSKRMRITKTTSGQNTQECNKCNGKGYVIVQRQLGPMMIQQQIHCNTCGGQGYKLKSITTDIDVIIPVGGRNGEIITLIGEGHKYPNHKTGDIKISLHEIKHNIFTRNGADLGMSHTLTLKEALCGYKFIINHVSGHKLIVQSQKGEIVQPGQLKRVLNWGMPIRYQTHTKGHLYIVMKVELPLSNSLNDTSLAALEKILSCGNNGNDNNKTDEFKDEEKENHSVKVNQNQNINSGGRRARPKRDKNDDSNDEADNGIYIEEVEAHNVDENEKAKATPASAKSSYDEDDQHEYTQCRHM